jgi:predicted helicase
MDQVNKEKKITLPPEITKKIIKTRNLKDSKNFKLKKKNIFKYQNALAEVAFYIAKSLDQILIKDFKRKDGLLDKDVKLLDPLAYRETVLATCLKWVYKKVEKTNKILGKEIVKKEFNYVLKDHIGKNFKGKVIDLEDEILEIPDIVDITSPDFLADRWKKDGDQRKKKKIVSLKNPIISIMSNIVEDDFDKFIRYAHKYIDKYGQGIIGVISDNIFSRDRKFLQVRKNLLKYYDKIYVFNLHGNINKNILDTSKEKDDNIFDLPYDLSISFFVKKDINGSNNQTEPKKEKTKIIRYADLRGTKTQKLDILKASSLKETLFQKIHPKLPNWYFVKKDNYLEEEFITYWDLSDIMPKYSKDYDLAKTGLNLYITLSGNDKFKDISSLNAFSNTQKNNFAFGLVDKWDYFFPVYLYFKQSGIKSFSFSNINRQPNFNPFFIEELSRKIKMEFKFDKRGDLIKTFGPEDLFYYIYAIVYSKNYRKRYSEQLENNFPRIPIIKNKKEFRKLVALGKQIADLRLFGENPFEKEETILDNYKKWQIKIGGGDEESLADWEITEIRYRDKNKRVYVNEEKYFQGIAREVWDFRIAGRKVLQEWLLKKYRAEKSLDIKAIKTFMKIAVSIRETLYLMTEVDKTIGDWPKK